MTSQAEAHIDWMEYYREFARIHGGNPVLFGRDPDTKRGGYLLFPDGWKYSATDKSGPEIPPPADIRLRMRLIKVYWGLRRRIVREELRKARQLIVDLVYMQQKRSAPLRVTTTRMQVVDEDTGEERRVVVSEEVDYEALLDRVQDFQDDLKTCEENLQNITIPEREELNNFSPASILARLESI